MQKIKQLFMFILLSIITIPVIVNADSGFDSNYKESSSVTEAIMSGGSSGLSVLGELIQAQPGDKDYKACHIILGIICLLILYIVICVYIFKLEGTKKKNTKKVLTLLGIGLIPTLLFSLFFFLTKLQLILYIFILILLIIPYIVVSKNILKKRLKNKISKLKDFDKDKFNQEIFEVYKNIQIAWMNFDYKKLKELVSEEIYEKYEKQLEELKSKNQKNIMDNIEFKSNKITDVIINDNIEIECEMNVNCIDYIIDNEDKLIKGKKDKIRNYTYRLVFTKEINNNKYKLIEKKMLKQK